MIMCSIIIFSYIEVPYRLVFEPEDDDLIWQIINNLVDSFFVIDMIFNFNSAFFNEDFVLVVYRKEICKNYIETWFTIDFLAIVPLTQPSVL